MRKLCFIICFMLIYSVCYGDGFNPSFSGTLTSDLKVGTNSIDGDSSDGLLFDPDNDGTNEILMTIGGAIEVTGIEDADNNTSVQVEESSDENIIRFDTAGTERMTIAADGNVGIGTTGPTELFHFSSSGTEIKMAASGVSVENGLFISGSFISDPCTAAREGAIFYNTTANEICFCDGSNDLRIKDASTACF